MKRRHFLGALAAASGAGFLSAAVQDPKEPTTAQAGDAQPLPAMLGGMRLESLREDYRCRLFEQYLPFWEKGGCDRDRGGFFCELNDDGSVASDEKFLWYQGRGIWVYAFSCTAISEKTRGGSTSP